MNNYNIILTDAASERLKQVTEDPSNENYKKILYITINKGGCAGFQYKYEFVASIGAEDVLLENNGASVAIDDFSAPLMKGSTIDYIESKEFSTSFFKITNPNAHNRCSCGNSFAI